MSSGGPRTAVAVPIKAFDQAKSRLSPALSAEQRALLSQKMACSVLTAASPLPCYVVCGDTGVADWAEQQGAQVLWYAPAGLNQALSHATRLLANEGFERLIIAHGDLPLARTLSWLAKVEEVMLIPDRHGLGTNVLSIPTTPRFQFHYGPNSASAHRQESERLGLGYAERFDPELSWDVDDMADLTSLPGQHPLSQMLSIP